MQKVAVIFGGQSSENEISILTGVFVMNVLDKEKYSILPLYVHTDGATYTGANMTDVRHFQSGTVDGFSRVVVDGGNIYELSAKKKKWKRLAKIDVAINCCHGGLAEGGGVAAWMQWNHVPLASPDLTSSGIFMDKCMTKTALRGLGIPVVEYIRVNERDYKKRGAFLLKSIERRLKYPVIVKPAHLGSSIGIAVANNEDEARQAIEAAFMLDDRVLIEKYIENKLDVNCAAYALRGEIFVSEPEKAFDGGVYTFEEKYIKRDILSASKQTNDGGRYAFKSEIRDKIRAYTKTVYKRMNLSGIVRMDFLVSGEKVYLCEVNTVPGSLAYYLFCERILDAKNLLSDLLDEAIVQQVETEKQVLKTGILNSVALKRK